MMLTVGICMALEGPSTEQDLEERQWEDMIDPRRRDNAGFPGGAPPIIGTLPREAGEAGMPGAEALPEVQSYGRKTSRSGSRQGGSRQGGSRRPSGGSKGGRNNNGGNGGRNGESGGSSKWKEIAKTIGGGLVEGGLGAVVDHLLGGGEEEYEEEYEYEYK